jgi:hypothetical protein
MKPVLYYLEQALPSRITKHYKVYTHKQQITCCLLFVIGSKHMGKVDNNKK